MKSTGISPEIENRAARSLSRMVDTDHGVPMRTLTPAQEHFVGWTIDVLTYVVVINLFAEFAPDHISIESFWITLLVALLFRALLGTMDLVKYRLQAIIRSGGYRLLATLGVLPVFFIGKLVILEIVDALFQQVSLSGFWHEWFLIFFLIVIPAAVWSIVDRLGS